MLLSTILFGTMKGERDGLFSPILGLLITSLLILALTGGLCVFLPEAKQEWPILLASTNSRKSQITHSSKQTRCQSEHRWTRGPNSASYSQKDDRLILRFDSIGLATSSWNNELNFELWFRRMHLTFWPVKLILSDSSDNISWQVVWMWSDLLKEFVWGHLGRILDEDWVNFSGGALSLHRLGSFHRCDGTGRPSQDPVGKRNDFALQRLSLQMWRANSNRQGVLKRLSQKWLKNIHDLTIYLIHIKLLRISFPNYHWRSQF